MEQCSFNHKNDPNGWPKATVEHALCLDGGIYLLPVCQECSDELSNPVSDWVALVCGQCASAQWSYRPQADRKSMPEDMNVLWCEYGCPKCGGK